jgi:aldose 1-epimerase
VAGSGRAVELRSPDGALEATYLPEAGMRCSSLRHHGAEILGCESAIDDPVLRSAMRGIPLLHPWANRLADDRYTAGGRTGEVPRDAPFVPRDGQGLAIHGLLAAPDAWVVTVAPGGSGLRAEMAFPTDAARAAAFPFPHRLALEAALDGDGLAVRVRLEPRAEIAVPVAFGFHPYLRLPGSSRSRWRVTLPPMTRVEADERGLPSGRRAAVDGVTGALAEATVDEAYLDVAPGAELAVADADLRVTLRLESGFRAAQVYSPAGSDFVCLEPMTAPPNALVTGEELAWVRPGERYEAAFRLVPARADLGSTPGATTALA